MEFNPDDYSGMHEFERKGLDQYNQHLDDMPRKLVQVSYKYKSFVENQAKMRSDIHKNHNSKTKYTEKYDELGVLGELAFQILTNVLMDTSISIQGDDYDFFINGYYIDVKASSHTHPRLYVKEKRLHDHYLYVVGAANLIKLTVEFCGWTTGDFIRSYGTYDTSKNEPAYYLNPQNLLWMDTLKDILAVPFVI